jgi:hypothetical protein
MIGRVVSNRQECGRQQLWPVRGTFTAFFWKDCGKPWKASVRISGLQDEIEPRPSEHEARVLPTPLGSLISSPSVIMIKSRRMRWAGRATLMAETYTHAAFSL